ncbi:MAG: FG-GAP-like repeat-containing protein [Gemmataceae bacterium]
MRNIWMQSIAKPFRQPVATGQRHQTRIKVMRLEDRCTPATLVVDPVNPADFHTIHDAVAAAASGDTIQVNAGAYTEAAASVIPAGATLTITGAGAATTIDKIGFDTGVSGDARAWFLINSGATLNMSGLTLDGSGHLVGDALRFVVGSNGGNVSGMAFKNIALTPTDYDGFGLNIKSGTVNVTNSTFTNIGRIGAQYTNAGTTGQFSGNTYTGKGTGDQLDYAVEVGDGANVVLSGNTVTNNKGIAADGSESAGFLVDTAGAPGTVATIIGNSLHDNQYGFFVGIQFPDSDSSSVVARYNNIFNNTVGAFSSNPTVDATHNWWGSTSGPQNATNNPTGTGNPVNNPVTFSSFGTGPKHVLSATSVVDYLSKVNDLYATGADAGGGPHVNVYNNDGSLRYSFFAYTTKFLGGVRVATGDVNGDGVDDIITGAGPGGGPHVEVFDGATGNLMLSFFAFAQSFTGGVYVAAGDFNGDGKADIVASSGAGIATDVRVFDGVSGTQIQDFQPYAGFTGGVTVAAADVNGDSHTDIITGAGPGGGPHVKVFDGTNFAVIQSFFAYGSTFTGGVYVASFDVNGDGKADIITGAGAGGGPHVKVFSGVDDSVLQSFFAFDPSFSGGVRVAAVQTDGGVDGDLLVSPGPSGSAVQAKIIDGRTLAQISAFSPYEPGFLGGVFVG